MTALTGAANVAVAPAMSPLAVGDRIAETFLTIEDRALLSLDNVVSIAASDDDKSTVLDFRYCGDPMTAIRPGDGEEVETSAAIKLPKELLQNYIGAKITAVNICAGFNATTYKNHVTDLTLFLSHDIFNQQPFYTQPGRLERVSRRWNEIPMKTPYVIDGKEDLYVGYSMIRPTMNDAIFVVDRSPNFTGCTLWTNYEYEGERKWEDLSGTWGSLCLRLTIEGDNLPQYDATITGLTTPDVVAFGTRFTGAFTVTNHGVKPISSVVIQSQVGNEEPVSSTIKLPKAIEYNSSFNVSLENIVCNTEGLKVPVTVSIVSVNGNDDVYPGDNSLTNYVRCFPEGAGFIRHFVFEEGTGTWCGYCPRGAYAMDCMLEKYDDGTFIGIAAHQGDPMQISVKGIDGSSQVDFNHGYGDQFTMVGSYPHARYGRVASYGTNIPSVDYVEEAYLAQMKIPAIADLKFDLYISDDNDTITVHGKTEFAIASEDEYRMVYVLLEDGLGPYPQSNYFAGTNRTEVGPWGTTYGNPQSTVFNHVARYVTSYKGVDGTVPYPVRTSEVYKHTATIPLANLMNKNIAKASVVGMIVNTRTGEIENALLVHCNDQLPKQSGIEDVVAAEGESAPVWYTIQGVRVAEPSVPGVYVKVTGAKSEKVLVK